jgi:hypothetical protein
MRVFVVVAVLIIPVMLFGVSCKKETPESKELAFEGSLQGSMSRPSLYAEADEDEGGAMYESEEEEGEDQDVGYESEEEEDVGYEPEEEESEDEDPTTGSDEDEQA